MRQHLTLTTALLFVALNAAKPQLVRLQDLRRDEIQTARPFGTLQQQADLQQAWLAKRLTTVLPALMRKHHVDMWVVPMREYNDDPRWALKRQTQYHLVR
jgi:hypothetical protein